MSPWWWYVLALLAIGAVLDIARAIAGPKVAAPALAREPGVVLAAPASIPVECPRCKWHGVLVPLATPPSVEAKR